MVEGITIEHKRPHKKPSNLDVSMDVHGVVAKGFDKHIAT